jgi:Secretion system C-terminal sorting domain
MSIYPNSTGGVGNIYRGILPTLGLTVDNKEPINAAVVTKVYPNPTTEAINLEFQKTNNSDWHVMLYDAAGKIISINRVSAAQGNVNQRITFDSALPSGTYFYNLLDETSLIRANGKVVLSR